MKKKISIAALVIAVILGIYFFMAPRQVGDNGVPAPPDTQSALEETGPVPDRGAQKESDMEATQPAGVEMEERARRMREEYTELEHKRDQLGTQLDDLRARIYNVELPSAQAQEINEELMKAFMLINNPPMLGAFHDTRDIRVEINKVERAQEKLEEIGGVIDSARASERGGQ